MYFSLPLLLPPMKSAVSCVSFACSCLQETDLGRDRDEFGNKPEYRGTSALLVGGNSAVGPIIMMRKSDGQAALTTCQDCEEAEAELECPECEMLYCPSCSRRIHSKGALARHGIKALEGPGQVARRTRDPGSIGAVGNGKGSGQWPGPDCDCQGTQEVTDGPCPAVLAVRNSNVSHVQPSGLPHTPSKLSAPRRVSAVISCDENDENQPASKAVAKSEKQHWVRIHSGDGYVLVLPVRLNAYLAGGRCWLIFPHRRRTTSASGVPWEGASSEVSHHSRTGRSSLRPSTACGILTQWSPCFSARHSRLPRQGARQPAERRA